MEVEELQKEITSRYDGLNLVFAYAEKSYFYNPSKELPRGVYFATIKESDGQNDKASNLNRDCVYRLSFGVSKQTYEELFGSKPSRPPKGGVVAIEADFAELNVLMPHPIYAWINWVSILNPQREQLPILWKLLDEKYEIIKKEYRRKINKYNRVQ